MTGYLDDGLVRAAVARSSLEWKLTDPHAFGLTTATPLQRAICRVADGQPLAELASHPDVRSAIGDVSALEPGHRPKEVCVLSAIRGAKTLTACCAAFHMALSADLTDLRPGEIPRIPVVSLTLDLADVSISHLKGSINASPLLRRFLLDETPEGVVIRHPSGTPIEICVSAGKRAGASLVARWLAGCIFDEFPRMVGGNDAVVNWDDQRNAILGRIRDGCQIWHIGSPAAPYGPAYDLATEHHGTAQRDLVVIKAPGAAMNPRYWTAERLEYMRTTSPEAYRTDALAEFATAEEALFSAASVDRAIRKDGPVTLPRLDGHTYFAAMDPATRGNGWTFAIATKDHLGRVVIVDAHEWQGSRDQPLDPRVVLEEAAARCLPYGVTMVMSDQVMGDALQALARQVGLHLLQQTYTAQQKAKKYLTIRTHLDGGRIELPPVKAMRTDLLHVRKVPTPSGVVIKLPQTSDGRHCDWAPTLMLALSRLLPDPEETAPAPDAGAPGQDAETKRLREEILARFQRRNEW